LTITVDIVFDDRLNFIADCLSEDWIDAWAREGVREVEDYLGKHAAFETYLETEE
jgi:hypothetical protein